MSVYDELMNERPRTQLSMDPEKEAEFRRRGENPSPERGVGDDTRRAARTMGGTHQQRLLQHKRYSGSLAARTTASFVRPGTHNYFQRRAPVRQAAGTTYEGPSLREMILELGTAAKEYLARRRGNNPGGKSGAELYQAIPRSAGRDVMRQSGYDWNSNRSSRTAMDMRRRKRAGIPVTNPGNAPERGEAGWEGLRHLKTVGQVRKNYPKAARDWTEYEGPSLREKVEYIRSFLEEGKRLKALMEPAGRHPRTTAAITALGAALVAGGNAAKPIRFGGNDDIYRTPPARTAPVTPGKAGTPPKPRPSIEPRVTNPKLSPKPSKTPKIPYAETEEGKKHLRIMKTGDAPKVPYHKTPEGKKHLRIMKTGDAPKTPYHKTPEGKKHLNIMRTMRRDR